MMSGGEVAEEFTEGWALKMLGRQKAHWWRRRSGGDSGVMLCRPNRIEPLRINNGQVGLFHTGGFPRCQRCMKIRESTP